MVSKKLCEHRRVHNLRGKGIHPQSIWIGGEWCNTGKFLIQNIYYYGAIITVVRTYEEQLKDIHASAASWFPNDRIAHLLTTYMGASYMNASWNVIEVTGREWKVLHKTAVSKIHTRKNNGSTHFSGYRHSQ